MKIRRFLSVLIACVSCITFFSVPVSAAESISNIVVSDMNVKAEVTIDTTPDDTTGGVITENVNISTGIMTGNAVWNGYYYFRFPAPTDIVNEKRLFAQVWLDDNFSIVSGHEYNLSFTWGYNVAFSGFCMGALRFYNNDGEIIKEQNLFVSNGVSSGYKHVVDISFIPDTSDLTSGYKCELVLVFSQNGYNSLTGTQYFFISPEITFIDKDDDSIWFQKIYNAIIQHDSNVDSAVSQLESKLLSRLIALDNNIDGYINTLDNHIKVYLQSLGNNLLAAISSLDSNLAGYIKSFQDSLIANDNSIFEALKEFLHNEMNPGVYDDPGSDDFQDNKDDWEQIEGELPTFDSSDMHEVDISNYSGGFGAVRYLFDRFLNASGLTTLMSFSLMFGLGVFLIGRKVGG